MLIPSTIQPKGNIPFLRTKRIDLVLTFDNYANKYFFPETPDIENVKIKGIQGLLDTQVKGNIREQGVTYAPIDVTFAKLYLITLYEKDTEAPIIDRIPFLSLIAWSAALSGNRVPGGNIKPFDFFIDTRRSYAEAPLPSPIPNYLPFLFYV